MVNLVPRSKLSFKQYQYYSSAFKNMAEGVILASAGVYFYLKFFKCLKQYRWYNVS